MELPGYVRTTMRSSFVVFVVDLESGPFWRPRCSCGGEKAGRVVLYIPLVISLGALTLYYYV